ncbi:MAG: four helix bundle protein [Saprospiraceae bacterium]|nr:four helix bundle protein [Saprospiraceae bacterium]
MFLKLSHTKLNIYSISRKFVVESYRITNHLPNQERFGMTSQIRRAALSVHLNISEGASRKSSKERKRFYEISRGSLIEIDAALDVANDLGYLESYDMNPLGSAMIETFKLLSGLIKVCEDNREYAVVSRQ